MKTGDQKRALRATPMLAFAVAVFAAASTGCGGGSGTDQFATGTGADNYADVIYTGQTEPSKYNNMDGTTNTVNNDVSDDAVTTGPSDTVVAKAALPAEFQEWKTNMITYGKKWGAFIANSANSSTERRQATYYDAAWVFQQIAQYTGQSEPWLSYAKAAKKVYRDGYLVPNNFKIPGYWRFAHGLGGDRARGGDTTLAHIRAIRDNPSFSNPDVNAYAWKWYHAEYAREIAYALQAQIVAEKAGEPRRETRVQMLVDMAANHLKQWRSANYTNPNGELDFLQPFMFALTSHALIEFYEWEKANGRNPDGYLADIPGKIAEFARWMYAEAKIRSGAGAGKRLWCANLGGTGGAWNDKGGTGYGAFRYKDTGGGSEPSLTPDLNLLIAPVYAWSYKMTGSTQLRSAADAIFRSGVKLGGVEWKGKIFNQNYRWSINYVKWRVEGDEQWAR